MSAPRRAFVISCWASGAIAGKGMGQAGYSYDFLIRTYQPLLERLGTIIRVPIDAEAVNNAVHQARSQGLDPVHLCFAPIQIVKFAEDAPNIVVMAWEFPQIPDHVFDDNPQNDWPKTAERLEKIFVGSTFNRAALINGGVKTPVTVVPAPVSQKYFDMEPWRPGRSIYLDCRYHLFQPGAPKKLQADGTPTPVPPASLKTRVKHKVKGLIKPAYNRLPGKAKSLIRRLKNGYERPNFEAYREYLRGDQRGIDLTGVVYTYIMNPEDGRKNWEDLLSAFVLALRHFPDATLVLKLASSMGSGVEPVLARCRHLGVKHQCKMAIVTDFLSDEQMLDLARASTYFLATTKAEGICMPFMDYLAAGRPGIAARHTALTDYFDSRCGFVVNCSPEPTPFAHDSMLRLTTRWQRLDWTSLETQLKRSYQVAKDEPELYRELSQNARKTLLDWAHPDVVFPQLQAALADVGARAKAA